MFALHAPDGFLTHGVALITAVVSAIVVLWSLRRFARSMRDHHLGLAAVVAGFVFAAQMFNFPVASGTSGHLMGGALAAILLGPHLGTLVVTTVVVVQAVVFADGGLTALGYNVLNMAIVPAFAGWAVFHLARRRLPASTIGVVAAAGLACGLSVVAASLAFSVQWLFGATAPTSFATVFTAMVGVHALIGIGEALLSVMVIGAVLAARPDLIEGVRDLDVSSLAGGPRISIATFVAGGLTVAVFFAVGVSQFASGAPDGLERVAIDRGFMESARDHTFGSGVLADYSVRGIDHAAVSLALAGLAGVVVTVLAGGGLVAATRRIGLGVTRSI